MFLWKEEEEQIAIQDVFGAAIESRKSARFLRGRNNAGGHALPFLEF